MTSMWGLGIAIIVAGGRHRGGKLDHPRLADLAVDKAKTKTTVLKRRDEGDGNALPLGRGRRVRLLQPVIDQQMKMLTKNRTS